MEEERKKKHMKQLAKLGLAVLLLVYIGTIVYQTNKKLPPGISYEGSVHSVPAEDVSFLYDLSYTKGDEQVHDQEIYKNVFMAIDEAEEFVVLDLFLYNHYYDKGMRFPKLSESLTEKLIEKKRNEPNVDIALITDEINTSYGSHRNGQMEQLQENGIEVIYTDVNPLRDSTPVYSAAWRMFFQWFGEEGRGRIPNAMANQAPKMTVRSYLKLLNIKANHRKTAVTDKTAIIMSGNPHDASALHSNIGFEVKGNTGLIRDLLATEQAAASMTGQYRLPGMKNADTRSEGDCRVQLVTEGKIEKHAIKMIDGAEKGEEIWLGMFYLADRNVIEALKRASGRGADVRLVLDPNENAFGSKKTGLPNRPVAQELNEDTNGRIQIRWYNTVQEQYHPKLMYVKKKDRVFITGGSANFTERNLDDLNLETNLTIEAPSDSGVARDVDHYFHTIWGNKDVQYTLSLAEYQNELTYFQRIIYFLQKALKLTTY